MEILRAEHISKTYGEGEGAVHALSDLSFTIEKGQFVAIIGPSGSGKSTLLHILGGIDEPTAGRVRIDGADLYALSRAEQAVFRRRQIGIVYQFFNLIPVLNVEENMALPLLLDRRRVDRRRLRELADSLDLSARLDSFPHQLSGGQQQRVSIARALINTPALLLADEPTGNLDSRNSQQVLELLKAANRRYHQTTIVITHEENIALQADRILTIEDGRITRDEALRR
ncbi:MAG: ABC transporter ATP-binding protein [Anaerovoracaceae bacterium]|jgi:putative ABC transport system ATP-binding protein